MSEIKVISGWKMDRCPGCARWKATIAPLCKHCAASKKNANRKAMKTLLTTIGLLAALAAGADEVSDLIGTNRARTTLEMAEPENRTLYGLTNYGSLLATNLLGITNGWVYSTNIGFISYTNTMRYEWFGVTNLVQLCAKIGHVWKPGPPDRTQVNSPELARHCILCGKLERHEGEWK